MHRKRSKRSCTLCSAAAYCCGAVAPRAIAALLGRFLPRLGPLAFASGPFFFLETRKNVGSSLRERFADRDRQEPRADFARFYSAAAWNGPRSPSGAVASA